MTIAVVQYHMVKWVWIWPYKPSLERRGLRVYGLCTRLCSPMPGLEGMGLVVSGVLGEWCVLWPDCPYHWVTVLLFLDLSGLSMETSVMRFVCSDSQYDLTAVLWDDVYQIGWHNYFFVRRCFSIWIDITFCVHVDVAVEINEYNVDVPKTVLCHLLLN